MRKKTIAHNYRLYTIFLYTEATRQKQQKLIRSQIYRPSKRMCVCHVQTEQRETIYNSVGTVTLFMHCGLFHSVQIRGHRTESENKRKRDCDGDCERANEERRKRGEPLRECEPQKERRLVGKRTRKEEDERDIARKR